MRLLPHAWLAVVIGLGCGNAKAERDAGAAAAPGGQAGPGADDVEVVVQGLRTEGEGNPVVLLGPADGSRVLPIWIGPSEALSIAMMLAEFDTPRPMTHDLVRSLLEATDARVERVTVTELRDQTYFARLSLAVGSRRLEIDSRPSDAIAIAMRTRSPIFVSRQLLGTAGLPPGGAEPPALRVAELGIRAQPLTAALAHSFGLAAGRGVLVAEVFAGGSADRAGLRPGDVILRLAGSPIDDLEGLTAKLGALPGSVEIGYRRGAEDHVSHLDRN